VLRFKPVSISVRYPSCPLSLAAFITSYLAKSTNFSLSHHTIFIINCYFVPLSSKYSQSPVLEHPQSVCFTPIYVGNFVDWRQYAAVMQREAVTVMPSCRGGGNVVVA
jgi:hypothetical protein